MSKQNDEYMDYVEEPSPNFWTDLRKHLSAKDFEEESLFEREFLGDEQC